LAGDKKFKQPKGCQYAHNDLIIPYIFLQPFSSACFSVFLCCLWHRKYQPADQLKVNHREALMQSYQINALPDHLPASKIAYLPLLMQPPEKAWGRSYKKKRRK
jgi:hypothetical protein